ncbi:MAG: DUF1934 domain-containing protein [Clostridia bacterium]|nr:DUF1934 domain-containing protein [Clostridia bacterium]
MLKKVRVQITTERYEIKGSLFDTPIGTLIPEKDPPPAEDDVEKMEMTMDASYHDDGTRVCIRYKESELTGMEGSTTSVSFQKSDPGVISMLRDGAVKTALIFEQHQRHLCVYQTQIMPFEVGVYTKKVHNGIEKDGILQMNYTVEIRGAQAEYTKFQMKILPYFDKPAHV